MNEDHKQQVSGLRSSLQQILPEPGRDAALYQLLLKCIDAFELEPERLEQIERLETDNIRLKEQVRKLRAPYIKESGMSSKLREALRE